MRTLFIEGWETLRTEGKWEGRTSSCRKAREGGVLTVKLSLIKLSHDVKFLNSEILKGEKSSLLYGAAFSAVDRAFQLGISALWETETARFEITLKGEFVHEICRNDNVEVVCELTYLILNNGKEAFRCSPKDKLDFGKQIKEVAIEKLNESNLDLSEYKRPIYLSTFLCLVRAIKWLSLISPLELEEENKEEFQLLKQQCYNNLCHFHLKFENFKNAVSVASVVLEQDHSNVKALYRRGVANLSLQNYELAEVDLLAVTKLDPTNSAAKKQLLILNERRKSLDNKLAMAMKKYLASS